MCKKQASLRLYFFTMITSLILQGCGGGGGGSNPPATSSATPISSSSMSSSSSATVSSVSSAATSSSSSSVQLTKITITGLVVAEDLANADIDFSVGTQHFTGKADAARKYAIELSVLPENLTSPFSAKVTGINSKTWIQFAASFPSVSKLKTLAGDDGILNVSEYFGVNMSPLTTAQFALINESKRKLKTDEDRKWALFDVSTERQSEMAALIRIFLTNTDYALPKHTATTLNFLQDKNTYSAYITALKIKDVAYLNETRDAIAADANQTKAPSRALEGKYLVESTNVKYLLDLNKDGTGRFHSGYTPSTQLQLSFETPAIRYLESPITWTKNDKSIIITFATPLSYGKIYAYFKQYANELGTDKACENNPNPICDLKLNSIQLTLAGDNEVSTAVKLSIDATITDHNGAVVYNYTEQPQYATLWNTADFYIAKNSDLEGAEWFIDSYKYTFNTGGKATQVDLLKKEEKTIDWKIENGHLVLDSRSTDIWLSYPTESGFMAMQTDLEANKPYYSAPISRIPLVKRQSVRMNAEDWVGRWSPVAADVNSSFYDVYANGHWRDGYDGESLGSWSTLSDTKQTALSNGNWRMHRDLLAIFDERYYIQICQGFEINPLPLLCSIEIITKDNSFSATTIWGTWTRPIFQEAANDSVWRFDGVGRLVLSTNSGSSTNYHFKLSANTLYNRTTGKVLQLISSTSQTIDLCEYPLFSNCSEGVVHKLARGIEITVSKSPVNWPSDANVQYLGQSSPGEYSTFVNGVTVAPKNKPLYFNVSPSSSDTKISSVIGCGGTLNGSVYAVPARTESCEITVNLVSKNN